MISQTFNLVFDAWHLSRKRFRPVQGCSRFSLHESERVEIVVVVVQIQVGIGHQQRLQLGRRQLLFHSLIQHCALGSIDVSNAKQSKHQ